MTQVRPDAFEIVHTQTAYAGWTRLVVATIRMPDGRTVKREIEDHGQSVCVLPYNPVRKTAVLVRQMRPSVLFAAQRQDSLEAIAGIVEDTTAEACARREAKEEALLTLDSIEHVFSGWTMPGLSTETMHFYLGVYSGEARPDIKGGLAGEHEATLASEFELAALARMVDRNELPDVKTMLLVQTLRLRRPDLF